MKESHKQHGSSRAYRLCLGKRWFNFAYLLVFAVLFANLISNSSAEGTDREELSPLEPQGGSQIEHTNSDNAIGKETDIDPTSFGAKGDGITDDTDALQKALTICSRNGWKCRIPANKKFLARRSLYIWGNARLEGDGVTSSIIFNVPHVGYLLNVGISGPNRLEKPFAGKISNLTFRVNGGDGGRIIFFWRTDGAQIINNVFDVGNYPYSATSSGNDNRWVVNGHANCVRKNIIIKGNIVKAKQTNDGGEGIGLASFDGALIENNRISGVGDDPIGIHYSANVKILDNDLKSVDGRIYVSNSKNVEVAHNRHERVASGRDGKFYGGIALVYIGFEIFEANEFAAPTNIKIHHNTLSYPKGAIDEGGAIYIYAPRNISVENNRVINDSPKVKATGFRMLPCPFSGHWRDPDRIDPAHMARVWDADIEENTMEGKYPLPMVMTGNCVDYKGDVLIKNNSAADFTFYCERVKLIGNIRIKGSTLPAQR